MRKKVLIVAFTIATLCISSIVWAKDPNFTGGIKVGMLWLQDKEYVQKVYGNTGVMFYSGFFSWKMIDDFELDAEIGYASALGRGVTPKNEAKTNQRYRLDMGPAQLGLIYRFNYVPEQIIVPYLGAGGNYMYYFEARVKESWHKSGGLFGYHGRAGLQVLLNNIEKRASSNLKNQYGIDNSYLFYEFQYNVTDNFTPNKGLDLSNFTHTLGVLIEF